MKKIIAILLVIISCVSLISCTDTVNTSNIDEAISIMSANINEAGELILSYSDGSEQNVGRVVGADGKDGKDGRDGIDGKDGVDGKDGKDGVDGKDGINGKNGTNGKDGESHTVTVTEYKEVEVIKEVVKEKLCGYDILFADDPEYEQFIMTSGSTTDYLAVYNCFNVQRR